MKKLTSHILVAILMLSAAATFALPQQAMAQIYPPSVAGVTINQQLAAAAAGDKSEKPACSLMTPSSWLTGCLAAAFATLVWEIIIPVTGSILWLVGMLIDAVISLSFVRDIYNSQAISVAWSIVRDICNMIFIFVLIFTGIQLILNINVTGLLKRTLIGVVIAAVFINFSLFITKVVIDASNVGTAWFIQGVKNIGGGSGVSDSVRSVLSMEKLKQLKSTPSDMSQQALIGGIATVAIHIIAIYVFIRVFFMLLGRLVAFFFLLITAPIGFVGHLLPQLKEYGNSWWKELKCNAMMAPMFFLMLYLTLYIADQTDRLIFGSNSTAGLGGSSFGPANYLMFAVIIMMLLKSIEISKGTGCKLGDTAGNFFKGAVGLATGTFLMGTVGRAAAGVAESKGFQSWAAKSGAVGEGAMRSMRSTASSSFGVKSAYKDTGIAKSGIPGVAEAFKNTDKGYAGAVKAQQAEREKFAKDAFGKGVEGAANRKAYAEIAKKGILSRVFNNGLTSKAQLVGTKDAIKQTFKENVTLTTTRDMEAAGKMAKAAEKEYVKEAGEEAKSAQQSIAKAEASNPQLKTLAATQQRIEKEISDGLGKLTESLTKDLNKLKEEEAALNKALAGFNEGERTIDGVHIDEYVFKDRLAKSKADVAAINARIVEAEKAVKAEKEVKGASSPEIAAMKAELEKVKKEYAAKKSPIVAEEVNKLKAKQVKLETDDEAGIDALIKKGNKQKQEDDSIKALKAIEKLAKGEEEGEKPEAAPKKEEGEGKKEA